MLQDRVEFVRPSAQYLEPTAVPVPRSGEIGYLVEQWAAELITAIHACNADKAAIASEVR